MTRAQVLLLNASAGVMIKLNDYLSPGSMNFIMTATFTSALLLIGAFVKEDYRRPLNAPNEMQATVQ